MTKKIWRALMAIAVLLILAKFVNEKASGFQGPEVVPVVESPLPPCPSKVPDTGVTAYVGCDSSIFDTK